MSCLGWYLLYMSYKFVLPHRTVFTMELSVDMTPCTPVPLVEIYIHMLPFMPILLVENFVHAFLQSYLLVIPCVCLSVQVLPWASVQVSLRESVIVVDVLCVFLSFCPRHSCEVTLAMALVQIMSTYRVLSGISCIIARNFRNVSPCSGLVNKSA